jgi:hypothetical protein
MLYRILTCILNFKGIHSWLQNLGQIRKCASLRIEQFQSKQVFFQNVQKPQSSWIFHWNYFIPCYVLPHTNIHAKFKKELITFVESRTNTKQMSIFFMLIRPLVAILNWHFLILSNSIWQVRHSVISLVINRQMCQHGHHF